MIRPRLLPAFAALLSIGAAAPLSGQSGAGAPPAAPRNGDTFGAWVLTCEAVGVNQTTCALRQRVLRASDRAFVADMLAFSNRDGSKRFLAARVPLGVHLASGFAIRPRDAETETPFVWQICNREICEALAEVTDDQLAEFDDAESMVGGFRPGMTAQPLVFGFSMAGVVDGLIALDASRATAP
ncbi:MAG: invasion associated locus B family protein [Paracoccaceae bacterium]|nr:MAG: invasion associated locus B family protein [Paracoccaceae bacterium]